MKKLDQLILESHKCIDFGFICKSNQKRILDNLESLYNNIFYTEKGNLRYPKKYIEAVKASARVYLNKSMDQNTIFCYVIDGVMATTYNDNKKSHYYFKGNTDIPYYRNIDGFEEKIISTSKNNEKITSGFFYPCGKPYYLYEI